MRIKRTCYVLVLTTSTFAMMTYWRVLHLSKQKYRFNPTSTCDFNWMVEKFSPIIYEEREPVEELNNKYFGEHGSIPTPISQNPVHEMSPDRYIFPLLEGGPNNQIFCLRETIFIAIKLNRTLVIPKFFKHFTDEQRDDRLTFIYPGHRVNLNALCKFISCVTENDFQKTCSGRLDGVIRFRNEIEAESIQKQTNMNLGNGDDFEILPHSEHYTKKIKIYSGDIKSHLQSEARCLVYQRPLFNLIIDVKMRNGFEGRKPAHFAISDYPHKYWNTRDRSLTIDIIKATQAPDYIRELADRFIEYLVSNEPLVTAHWRYNKGDYMKRCIRQLKYNGTRTNHQKLCKNIIDYTSEDLAKSIEEKVLASERSTRRLKHIYIASPGAARDFVSDAARILQKNKGWIVHSTAELEEHVANNYDCDVLRKHTNDIISTLEMEICARGIIYLRSEISTWSMNVQLSRYFNTRIGTFPEMDAYIM